MEAHVQRGGKRGFQRGVLRTRVEPPCRRRLAGRVSGDQRIQRLAQKKQPVGVMGAFACLPGVIAHGIAHVPRLRANDGLLRPRNPRPPLGSLQQNAVREERAHRISAQAAAGLESVAAGAPIERVALAGCQSVPVHDVALQHREPAVVFRAILGIQCVRLIKIRLRKRTAADEEEIQVAVAGMEVAIRRRAGQIRAFQRAAQHLVQPRGKRPHGLFGARVDRRPRFLFPVYHAERLEHHRHILAEDAAVFPAIRFEEPAVRRAPAFERLSLAGRQLRRHIRKRHDRDRLRLDHAARTAIEIGNQTQRARLGPLFSARRERGKRRRRGALPSREHKPQKRVRAALRRFKMIAAEQRRVRRPPALRQKIPVKPLPSAGDPFVQRSRHRFSPLLQKKPPFVAREKGFLSSFSRVRHFSAPPSCAPCRYCAGVAPTYCLKRRMKLDTSPYPTSAQMSLIGRSVCRSRRLACSMRSDVR